LTHRLVTDVSPRVLWRAVEIVVVVVAVLDRL
jgi:hypothetical protein